MTEPKKPQEAQRHPQEQEIELEVPRGADVEIEMPNKPMEQKAKVSHETKEMKAEDKK